MTPDDKGLHRISPVLTATELCDYLRISRATLYRMIKAGEIPAFRLGGEYRFNRELIDAWMKNTK